MMSVLSCIPDTEAAQKILSYKMPILPLNLSLLSNIMGRRLVRAGRVYSPVLHAAHIVKYITSKSTLIFYKSIQNCFAGQAAESDSRTLAKNTLQLMASLEL